MVNAAQLRAPAGRSEASRPFALRCSSQRRAIKNTGIVLLLLANAGCGSIPEKRVTGQIVGTQSAEELSLYLESQAIKCWEREWGFFGDGVIIKTRIDFRGRVIEAHRYAPDIGLRLSFVEIIVVERENQTSEVFVIEGDDMNILSDVSLVPEVRQWVGGSDTCITKK